MSCSALGSHTHKPSPPRSFWGRGGGGLWCASVHNPALPPHQVTTSLREGGSSPGNNVHSDATVTPAISMSSLSSTWERRKVRLPALQLLAYSQVQGRGCLQIAHRPSTPLHPLPHHCTQHLENLSHRSEKQTGKINQKPPKCRTWRFVCRGLCNTDERTRTCVLCIYSLVRFGGHAGARSRSFWGDNGWPRTQHEEEDFGLALFEFRIVSIYNELI